ncbi:MAG TPA: hypothetical protein DIT07_08825, partial [Sphingobacteriaceae bacterium]|nr:hypothetical protein [Sphingobacteriaceae bacterium]
NVAVLLGRRSNMRVIGSIIFELALSSNLIKQLKLIICKTGNISVKPSFYNYLKIGLLKLV